MSPVPPLLCSLESTATRLCPQHATKTALVKALVILLLPSALAISQSSSSDLSAALDLTLLLKALSPLGWNSLHFSLSLLVSISLSSPPPSLTISPPTSTSWDLTVQCSVLFSMLALQVTITSHNFKFSNSQIYTSAMFQKYPQRIKPALPTIFPPIYKCQPPPSSWSGKRLCSFPCCPSLSHLTSNPAANTDDSTF